eukprot:TRINITY_DN46886_c0_g1_i1.p2 TRINITY_DN46886_c0_g1~~TRINITY_DN46886_c0_g1_i1.p2  ORF type:complete len:203 (+),score=32.37 TRINITY_DN46886_c0_g1_i1:60-611(+)
MTDAMSQGAAGQASQQGGAAAKGSQADAASDGGFAAGLAAILGPPPTVNCCSESRWDWLCRATIIIRNIETCMSEDRMSKALTYICNRQRIELQGSLIVIFGRDARFAPNTGCCAYVQCPSTTCAAQLRLFLRTDPTIRAYHWDVSEHGPEQPLRHTRPPLKRAFLEEYPGMRSRPTPLPEPY